MLLGKTLQDGVDYTKVAAHYRATYFKLDNCRDLAKKLTPDELWKVNEAFPDQQIRAGKQIILSPNLALRHNIQHFCVRELGTRSGTYRGGALTEGCEAQTLVR